MIAEQVAKYPILLDELLDPNALLNPTDFNQYSSELRRYLLRLPADDGKTKLIMGYANLNKPPYYVLRQRIF